MNNLLTAKDFICYVRKALTGSTKSTINEIKKINVKLSKQEIEQNYAQQFILFKQIVEAFNQSSYASKHNYDHSITYDSDIKQYRVGGMYSGKWFMHYIQWAFPQVSRKDINIHLPLYMNSVNSLLSIVNYLKENGYELSPEFK